MISIITQQTETGQIIRHHLSVGNNGIKETGGKMYVALKAEMQATLLQQTSRTPRIYNHFLYLSLPFTKQKPQNAEFEEKKKLHESSYSSLSILRTPNFIRLFALFLSLSPSLFLSDTLLHTHLITRRSRKKNGKGKKEEQFLSGLLYCRSRRRKKPQSSLRFHRGNTSLLRTK